MADRRTGIACGAIDSQAELEKLTYVDNVGYVESLPTTHHQEMTER